MNELVIAVICALLASSTVFLSAVIILMRISFRKSMAEELSSYSINRDILKKEIQTLEKRNIALYQKIEALELLSKDIKDVGEIQTRRQRLGTKRRGKVRKKKN